MGYASETFEFLSGFNPPRNGRILDLGSQDVGINLDAEMNQINKVIAGYGGQPIAVRLPATLPTREVWTRAGFHYACIDVDQRPETIRVDLQSLDFPRSLRSSFDVICNSGTTEHLANPVFGLAFMHYVCKPGGLMYHDVPLFGLGNHGLTNPTPKFWHSLAEINGYEVLYARVRHCDDSHLAEGNFFHPNMDYIGDLRSVHNVTWMIRFVVRKRTERVFIPPFDAVLPDSYGKDEAVMIAGSMMPFLACELYSIEEVTDAIDGALATLGKPYRIGKEPSASRDLLPFGRSGMTKLATKALQKIRRFASP